MARRVFALARPAAMLGSEKKTREQVPATPPQPAGELLRMCVFPNMVCPRATQAFAVIARSVCESGLDGGEGCAWQVSAGTERPVKPAALTAQ